jgi:hypothetical protein
VQFKQSRYWNRTCPKQRAVVPTPLKLAESLLARRIMLRDALPGVIRTLQAEEEAIFLNCAGLLIVTRRSNKEVARLKKDRNELRDAARPKLERLKQLRTAIDESGGMITLEPKWAKERLEEKITEIENKIETQALGPQGGRESYCSSFPIAERE